MDEGFIELLVPNISSNDKDLCLQCVRALGNLCYEQGRLVGTKINLQVESMFSVARVQKGLLFAMPCWVKFLLIFLMTFSSSIKLYKRMQSCHPNVYLVLVEMSYGQNFHSIHISKVGLI